MNKKRIRQRLSKVFNQWVDTIEDEQVRNLVRANTIITGGCIASLLMNKEPHDYDIYFTDKETVLSVANYYVGRFNDKAVVLDMAQPDNDSQLLRPGEYESLKETSDPSRVRIFIPSDGVAKLTPDKKKTHQPVYMSPNAITLTDRIQIITRFYGQPREIHENFDFIHCCNYWASHGDFLVLKHGAIESILAQELSYCGSKYPLCSIIRLRKFIKRGWYINAGEILKICFQLSDFDLSDPVVLEDQLVGVDSAYFNQVIRMLKEGGENQISASYLVTVIDKVFN
jgi:hypothetical protein